VVFNFVFTESVFTQGCGITASCNFTTSSVIGKQNIGCFGDSTGNLDLVFYNSGVNYPYCFEWRKGITRIGLDGKYVRGTELVHHLADLDEGKSIAILPNLSQAELKKNFKKFPKKTG